MTRKMREDIDRDRLRQKKLRHVRLRGALCRASLQAMGSVYTAEDLAEEYDLQEI